MRKNRLDTFIGKEKKDKKRHKKRKKYVKNAKKSLTVHWKGKKEKKRRTKRKKYSSVFLHFLRTFYAFFFSFFPFQ